MLKYDLHIHAHYSPCSNLKSEVLLKIAKKLKIAEIAGSDAHFRFEIAKAYTIFDDDLRNALKHNKTSYKAQFFMGLLAAY